MSFVNFICESWSTILVVAAIITAIVVFVVKFLRLSPEQQKERIKTSLLAIVTEMEKQYGPKTGIIKRSQAYNQLVELFPVLTIFLSQATFDKLLDEALAVLNASLESNKEVAVYVGENKDVSAND